ncbi:phage portal protein [Clostridium sp. HBUAS56017]|uniref:phage portal protein n=1 Tax=Clostridium sp. HBUAS56017 TaxID=2571128 RepID=UPI0011786CA5|nr:phage portal protein [Clostridium sp. HBUAS56017]
MFERLKELIKGVFSRMFSKNTIQDATKIDIAVTDSMSLAIDQWTRLYENRAPWLSDTVQSMNIPASIATEMARLVTIEFTSEISKDDFLNKEYQVAIDSIRRYTEYACAKGGLVFKPYVVGDHIEVDMVQADSFFPTSYNSRGEITGAIFAEVKQEGKKQYTRLEYHNLTDQGYYITNTAYMYENAVISNQSQFNLGRQIPLTDVEDWSNLEEETLIANIDKPLFSYFKIPQANAIESNSPLGVSVYQRAIDLIMEADKQYSRILWEYEGSELAINASIDCFKLDREGNPILPEGKKRLYRSFDVDSNETKKLMEPFSPTIRDTSLFNGLNNILRKIEFNCGLAYGTLSDVNETDKTATEIKASKQRSYSTVKDIQKSLQNALEGLVYAMSTWAKIYKLDNTTINTDKDISFNWDDSLVLDKETELASMQADVAAGILRAELYLAKKYGVTEEEALKMMPEINSSGNDPFADTEE